MATKNNRSVPARAIHPGEILREELLERGIKQKDFAQQIGMQPSHLNSFIKGKRNLNDDLAIKLERHLGISYQTWMNLHHGYMYDCKAIAARCEEEQQAMDYESACAEVINLKCLYKRLSLTKLSCQERVRKLKELFPFDLFACTELLSHVSGLCKYGEKVQTDEKNIRTWIVLNWLETSKSVVTYPYTAVNALEAAQEIAQMANSRTMTIERIKTCLEHYGISYLEVQPIEKAPIDSCSTIANGHPCLTVTYLQNDMDKLAFDILHELCHIDRHLSNEHNVFISMEGNECSNNPREKEAHLFALQMLIPDKVWSQIVGVGCKSLVPFHIVKTIAAEAQRIGISPSIAITRYKHDTGWYKTTSYKSPKIFG